MPKTSCFFRFGWGKCAKTEQLKWYWMKKRVTFARTWEGSRSQSDTSYYKPVFANHAKNLRIRCYGWSFTWRIVMIEKNMWGDLHRTREGSCSQSYLSYYQLVFANKILDSDFSGQNTPVVTALLKLQIQMLSRGTHEVELIVRKKSVLNFTNEILDDNEDTTDDDACETKHSWRHCENCEKKKIRFWIL